MASVYPESLPVAGPKGHDINDPERARLQPLKDRFCSCDTDWSPLREMTGVVSGKFELPAATGCAP